jgi:nanoRNase/pAp phosphatase (c-di-AMP/oligoRNAs hydrolase)
VSQELLAAVDRSSTADIGAAMLRHGGGGHRAAGTCQVAHDRAEEVLEDVIRAVGSSPVAV